MFQPLDTTPGSSQENYHLFQRYELAEAFNPASASSAALDFITGLRQFREKAKEEEDELTEEFEKKMIISEVPMVIDNTEKVVDVSDFKPKFIPKKDRQTTK